MKVNLSLIDFQNMGSMYGSSGMGNDGYSSQRNSGGSVSCFVSKYEPPRGKTNNVVSEQVWQKPACTSTEKS